jgi:hypothetical protein
MPELGAFLEPRTLYRGQVRRYDAVRGSGWRAPYADAAAMEAIRHRLAAFLQGHSDVFAFMEAVRSVELDADPPRASCARWIRNDVGAGILAHLVEHVRNTVSPLARHQVGMAVLAEVEGNYLARYQSFVFNRKQDPFFAKWAKPLFALADSTLEFFERHRDQFDVDFRIFQVVRDLSGVLQHYGVLGTPGVDLTDDLDVALWFATHEYRRDDEEPKRYHPLPPEDWGVVYTAEIPTVRFSPVPCGAPIDILPGAFATDLGSISPLFTRIRRQRGWYGAPAQLWEHGYDFAAGVPMRCRPARDFGPAAQIAGRLRARGLTQDYLFPSRQEDPFRAHLAQAGIEAFP